MATREVLTIDGSHGEGGGQVVRSALALSAVMERPFVLNKVRAKRSKPGLKRQHLTAVRAAAQICSAEVEGDDLNSSRLEFHPQRITGGNFNFQIGTAGSTTLVAQTVLPALFMAECRSEITVEGGTHNPMAPPFDFLQRVYFPCLRAIGVRLSSELVRYGFYPAGGGRFRVGIEPLAAPRGISILDSGKLVSRRVVAVVAKLPRHIAQREIDTIVRKSGWKGAEQILIETDADSPGNVVMIELQYENVSNLFVALGRQGLKAERVAAACLRDAKSYLKQDAPVGTHLADQLMLPTALAAHFHQQTSEFRTGPLSNHSLTQIDLISQFLEVRFEQRAVDGCVVVSTQPY